MSRMKLAIAGAAGRMGQSLIRVAQELDRFEIVGALEAAGHEALGRDAGEIAGTGKIGVPITDDALPVLVSANGLVDFSTPAATVKHAELCAQARIVHVIGTTGIAAEDDKKIVAASRHATIIRAGNFSLGVNLLERLTELAAHSLEADFDIEIVEMHHRHKVDAPSGTALMLGEAAAAGRGVSLDEAAERGRDGMTGPRGEGRIGFASLRGGSVVGDHAVIFAGPGERIEIRHHAEDRSIFSRGALKAALWGWNEGNGNKGPGLFGMDDVLGLGRKSDTPRAGAA